MQIENEYGNVESSFGKGGKEYVKWAARMALSLDAGIPWVMCRQTDAPHNIYDKKAHIDDVHHIDVKTGLQIREALQLQLDVQRRLHEQLEIQIRLQLRIEEQGKQLKMMFDQQQKTCNGFSDLDNTENNDASVSHKEAEGSGNSSFPSKIS